MKEYSKGIFHTIWWLPSNKREEKGGGKGPFVTTFVLCSNCYACWSWKPYFLGSGWTWLADGEYRILSLLLLPRVAFAFSLLNCIYLNPWHFSILFSLLHSSRGGGIEWLGGQLVFSQGQPTTLKKTLFWQPSFFTINTALSEASQRHIIDSAQTQSPVFPLIHQLKSMGVPL